MKNFQFIILFGLLFLTPISIWAFSAEVVVDTGRENINALEVTIHVPDGVLINEVNNGNSALLFWVEKPQYSSVTNTIHLSGITPGGFLGTRSILSVSGDFSVKDLEKFHFSNIQALRNDGEGTPVSVKFSLKPAEVIDDVDPPENFQPLIGQNEDIYSGQYFLVFVTQDKGVGMDHYEVREGYFGSFTVVESPYLLKHQSLNRKIFIKAFDVVGNERSVVLAAQESNKWYRYTIFAILLLMIIYVFFVKKHG